MLVNIANRGHMTPDRLAVYLRQLAPVSVEASALCFPFIFWWLRLARRHTMRHGRRSATNGLSTSHAGVRGTRPVIRST